MAATNQAWRNSILERQRREMLEQKIGKAIGAVRHAFAVPEDKRLFGIYLKRCYGLTEIYWAISGQRVDTVVMCANSQLQPVCEALLSELAVLRAGCEKQGVAA